MCPCPGPNNISNKPLVFARAFDQEPDAGTEIHHALLWEFRLIYGHVDQWQWFIELTPSPEFRQWLIEDNAFMLEHIQYACQYRTAEDMIPAPRWFQVQADTTKFSIYQSEDGRMRLFERITDGRIYMTDFGIQ
jgi:hypothetical protein